MAVHFSRAEFSQRVAKTCQKIINRKLDGLLMFAPESHYYLTGYDTFGFSMFQCMVLSADGEIHLLTRLPDLRQAQQTSTLTNEQIHVWREDVQSDPYRDLLQLLEKLKLAHGKLGIETKTVGLTAFHGENLKATLSGRVEFQDASDLVGLIRRVKSPQEIEYHKKAAELSDLSLAAGLAVTEAGAFEGDILAAMQGAVFKAGGSYAGNEFIVGSGENALLCRYHSGPRTLDRQDQLTLEWSGAYYRYHAAMMRTLVIGKANEIQRKMHGATVEALVACEEMIKPGNTMGQVFDAHARVFGDYGFGHAAMQACGYGMGATFNPIWVDFPMFYKGNPLKIEAGNVFFLHMILMDSDSGLAMCWGHSVLVIEQGIERLSTTPLDLIET